MLEYLAASVKPAAGVIATAALATLTDYQSAGHWTPALVDGGRIAALMVIGLLGVQGAASGVSKVAAANSAAKAPPA